MWPLNWDVPGISATVREVEMVAKLAASYDGVFEERNPISNYIINKQTGEMEPSVLDEHILSGIIEVSIKNDRLLDFICVLIELSRHMDTVFSLDVACLVEPDGTIPAKELFDKEGIFYRPNCKTNVGLGRPRYEQKD